MDLTGVWRAAAADDQLRRTAVGLDFDDTGWVPVSVPGHWRNEPAFAASDGPLLLRTHFSTADPVDGRRMWIVLDGVFYQADVWLDGAYLGDPEGYFFPHSFDVTQLAALGSEHVLAIEVACSPQRAARGRRNITGVFQQWNAADRTWNPGGLWRPVRIESTGPVRLERLRVLCRDANDVRAHLRLHARLDSDASRRVRIRTTVTADGGQAEVLSDVEQSIARGVNEVGWNLDIDNPRLWWPWSLGDQPLTEVRVDVLVDGETSDGRTVRTGLREVAVQDWVFSVNGERLFLKGANLAPVRLDIASAAPADFRRDVELARDAGLDLLRVHAHISAPALYDAADDLGMLLWQDFPLEWSYARDVRRRAVTQATEAVFQLGHHPSILTWCAHNEPSGPPPAVASGAARGAVIRHLAVQQLPSWNKNILDRWVKRSFEKADESRPTISHSGVMPHLAEPAGTDSHLYFGWYHGHERDLPGFAATVPRMVRFVSEFGAQAVPDSSGELFGAASWPDLDWDELELRHGLQRSVLEQHVPSADHASFEKWRDATQRYQAALLRHHIETLRRLKYHPTGGFCLFMLNDAGPAISWSILDHRRVPKLAYDAVTEACRPVVVIADRLPAAVAPGASLALDVHIVNDLRVPVVDAVLRAHLRWTSGQHEWAFTGTAEADSVALIGVLQFVVPDAPGELRLDLTLEGADVAATNRDHTTIVAAG